MNEDVKKEWVANLRASKVGDTPVKQTRGVLMKPDPEGEGITGMCCLGVLSAMAAAEPDVGVNAKVEGTSVTWILDERDGYSTVEREGGHIFVDEALPAPVQKWAGLSSDDPLVTISDDVVAMLKKSQWTGLDSMDDNKVFLSVINDFTELGFAGIADLIEEQL